VGSGFVTYSGFYLISKIKTPFSSSVQAKKIGTNIKFVAFIVFEIKNI
jgi:hypothetical protein